MTETDWTKCIGRWVKGITLGGFDIVGTLEYLHVYPNHTFWFVKDSGGTILTCDTEPTLLPEEPEWHPRNGEWVTGWRKRPETALRWSERESVKGYRPLTDDELIDVCGGIERMRKILRANGYNVEERS